MMLGRRDSRSRGRARVRLVAKGASKGRARRNQPLREDRLLQVRDLVLDQERARRGEIDKQLGLGATRRIDILTWGKLKFNRST